MKSKTLLDITTLLIPSIWWEFLLHSIFLNSTGVLLERCNFFGKCGCFFTLRSYPCLLIASATMQNEIPTSFPDARWFEEPAMVLILILWKKLNFFILSTSRISKDQGGRKICLYLGKNIWVCCPESMLPCEIEVWGSSCLEDWQSNKSWVKKRRALAGLLTSIMKALLGVKKC